VEGERTYTSRKEALKQERKNMTSMAPPPVPATLVTPAAMQKAVAESGGTAMLVNSILGITLGGVGLIGSSWAISAFSRLRKQTCASTSANQKKLDTAGLSFQVFTLVVSIVTIVASIIVLITGRRRIAAGLIKLNSRFDQAYNAF
jgi:hypothetical protein